MLCTKNTCKEHACQVNTTNWPLEQCTGFGRAEKSKNLYNCISPTSLLRIVEVSAMTCCLQHDCGKKACANIFTPQVHRVVYDLDMWCTSHRFAHFFLPADTPLGQLWTEALKLS